MGALTSLPRSRDVVIAANSSGLLLFQEQSSLGVPQWPVQDPGSTTPICTVPLESNAILVRHGNDYPPSGFREGYVMWQCVFLLVFWIYFCIGKDCFVVVVVKGCWFYAFNINAVVHVGVLLPLRC